MYFMTSIQLHLETTRIILKWSLLCGISSWNCSARGDFKNAPKDFVSVIVQKSTSHLWSIRPVDARKVILWGSGMSKTRGFPKTTVAAPNRYTRSSTLLMSKNRPAQITSGFGPAFGNWCESIHLSLTSFQKTGKLWALQNWFFGYWNKEVITKEPGISSKLCHSVVRIETVNYYERKKSFAFSCRT